MGSAKMHFYVISHFNFVIWSYKNSYLPLDFIYRLLCIIQIRERRCEQWLYYWRPKCLLPLNIFLIIHKKCCKFVELLVEYLVLYWSFFATLSNASAHSQVLTIKKCVLHKCHNFETTIKRWAKECNHNACLVYVFTLSFLQQHLTASSVNVFLALILQICKQKGEYPITGCRVSFVAILVHILQKTFLRTKRVIC